MAVFPTDRRAHQVFTLLSMEFSTSQSPTMFGQSMPARDQIWHYSSPLAGASTSVNVAWARTGDRSSFSLPMPPHRALTATTEVRWQVQGGRRLQGLLDKHGASGRIGNHLLIGVSGDFDNLTATSAPLIETGADAVAVSSTPRLGRPIKRRGGMTWMTGTYDPDLNLVFWGTGNPTPVLKGSTRPGDNLYTCSIVALNPDTGKLAWAFLTSPHDTHDWDAVETPVLVDADFHGQPKKMLMQSSRNGYFFVLDRTNGKSLLTVPYGPVNWSLGIDKEGRPIPNPAKEPAPDGRLIAPDEEASQLPFPSFDRKPVCCSSITLSWASTLPSPRMELRMGWRGLRRLGNCHSGVSYQTGKIRWGPELGPKAPEQGVLTTDSGLTFTGDAMGGLALDSRAAKRSGTRGKTAYRGILLSRTNSMVINTSS